LLHCQRRQVTRVDRLQLVFSISKNAEDRQAAQHPGDVIDQDVLFAEDHRGSQDGIRQTAFPYHSLELSFAAKILQR